MKVKRLFATAAVFMALSLSIILYVMLFTGTSDGAEPFMEPQNQGEPQENAGDSSNTMPDITIPISPGSSSSSSDDDDEGGSAGISGGGSDEAGQNETIITIVNYTLSIDSLPPNLMVVANYTVGGEVFTEEYMSPFVLNIRQDTLACFLLSQISGSGVIGYKIDGHSCEPSTCLGFVGCSVVMNESKSALVSFTPANVTE